MSTLKRYFVILLVTFFTVAASGTVAMAHCDNSAHGFGDVGIEKKIDNCNHSHSAKAEKSSDHKSSSEKTHSCCNTGSSESSSDSNDPTNQGNEAQTSSCIDCGAGFCQTQNVVTAKTSAAFYATLSDFLTSKNINLTAAFLTKIPDPPNFIS